MRGMTTQPTPDPSPKPSRRRKTVPDFQKMKSEGRKITMLTAYDYPLYLNQSAVQYLVRTDLDSHQLKGHKIRTGVQLIYNEKAREAGVYILQSCGFDSIPADLGLVFTQQEFGKGDLNEVESYLQLQQGPEVW